MKTFLEFVAEDIIKKHGTELSGIAVVFPNKRASLYLNGYLARLAGKPLWSPAYVTISDLYRQQSDLMVGDSVKLICELYKSFIKCTGIEETLDHFYGWGQLLLADFDDIDKNMADADQVFANVSTISQTSRSASSGSSSVTSPTIIKPRSNGSSSSCGVISARSTMIIANVCASKDWPTRECSIGK